MKKIYTLLIYIIIFSSVSANGLMMPVNHDYPYDFLRNTVTRVNVDINGLVAETTVYQEFKNEWYDSTDAVYSFPLPPDARAVKFSYWYDGIKYKAVLKVKEQATNPGTGQGGVAAEVNRYIGRNGIKILLTNIHAGDVQRVELHYLSICDYYMGRCSYRFPLETGDFTDYQLDNLTFNIDINSNSQITDFDITSHSGYNIIDQNEKSISAEYMKSKAYINTDFEFYYDIKQDEIGVDFYSVANDSSDGHFALFVKPQVEADNSEVIPQRIIFILSNSSTIFGNRFQQNVDAVKLSLDNLNESDYFNIIVYNFNISKWRTVCVNATPENIQFAKEYLDAVTTTSGSRMDLALDEALSQITDDSFNNSIIVFTNGWSPLDPKGIETKNTYKAGIYPVGMGDDLDRARLEMTASLNYGYVTYIEDNDNIKEKIQKLLDLVSKPLLKEVGMEYGKADVSQLVPDKFPSASAGSMFYVAGRYSYIGQSAFSLAGISPLGMQSYDFNLEFSENINEYKFAESIWAKMKIDELERDIEIYGETEEKKQELIDLSLKYNIRCRYTAYIADYHDIDITRVEEVPVLPDSYILGNYPNPFNPTTTIRFYISNNDAGSVKLIRIYNSIGQLVRVIDITNFSPGWNEVVFNGRDQFGAQLSSGIYFVQFISGGRVFNTIKMNLLK